MKIIINPSERTYKADCPYCGAVLECQWNDFKDKNKGTDMMPYYITYCPICKGTIALTKCEVINP